LKISIGSTTFTTNDLRDDLIQHCPLILVSLLTSLWCFCNHLSFSTLRPGFILEISLSLVWQKDRLPQISIGSTTFTTNDLRDDLIQHCPLILVSLLTRKGGRIKLKRKNGLVIIHCYVRDLTDLSIVDIILSSLILVSLLTRKDNVDDR
jgi:hypothetical protein